MHTGVVSRHARTTLRMSHKWFWWWFFEMSRIYTLHVQNNLLNCDLQGHLIIWILCMLCAVEASWYWCVHLTLFTMAWVKSHYRLELLSFSKTCDPHCFSRPHVKMVTCRMQTLFVAWCGMCAPPKRRLARMLPRELQRCTISPGLILDPVTGGNNTL